MTDKNDYEVKLEIFEGPLDLLIHLIRKNEVDIFDIPISKITDQYLEYIDMMRALNMSVAGDFLVMASTLLHIKSRMLLPGLDDDEEDDPRIELTRPLLEYMKLKEIAGELSERDMLGREIFTRQLTPEYFEGFEGEETMLEVSLFKLMDAFKKVIDNLEPESKLHFEKYQWSLEDKTIFIAQKLEEQETLYFLDLFHTDMTKEELVITFLALLELIRSGSVRVFQAQVDKDIRLQRRSDNNGDMQNG